jgi:hypothetical protein
MNEAMMTGSPQFFTATILISTVGAPALQSQHSTPTAVKGAFFLTLLIVYVNSSKSTKEVIKFLFR